MRTYCIACGVFRKDLEQIVPSLIETPVILYLEGGLHAEPDLLRKELQTAIDKAPEDTERIVLLYGVCGKGIVGLRSSCHPIVIPRVHDCISLFLGGTREYRKQFSHKPGTYYISPGWYEEHVQPKGSPKKHEIQLPGEYTDTLDQKTMEDRFGKENSKTVSDFFNAWKKNYTRAVFIDTGSGDQSKYADYARSMAQENDWEYTRLEGSQNLILQCLSLHPEEGPDDVLVVPAGHEILFDSPTGLIHFASDSLISQADKVRRLSILGGDPGFSSSITEKKKASLGLGIDAGGTYTDAVLFDFEKKIILNRSKSLTTKWKYSLGIMSAVRQLPQEQLNKVDLVSLSTTLVTNAIVESNLYPVGLLIMPLGTTLPENISHKPYAVINGRMTIEGHISQGINPDEIKAKAKEMITRYGVKSFAVSGYGASVNPALELEVKGILRESTGLDVCCGHELSGSLNFYVRAHTAVLNAGVIPIMEEFLREMKIALSEVSVDAPCLVVKGDGSVMTGAYASEFPVQTALSGPAASMAGARFLTGLSDALVIDVGGTTSDIGFLEEGEVSICEEGARIGSWRTHIKAVDMLTTGLGGDSSIVFDRQVWNIGPGRITPFCWINMKYDLKNQLKEIKDNPPSLESSIPLQWLYRTDKQPDFPLTRQEEVILSILDKGPALISMISSELTHGVWKLLKTERLEKTYCIQRAGLTPTDLYHIQGKIDLWSGVEVSEYFELNISLQKDSGKKVLDLLLNYIKRKIGKAILFKIFPEITDSPGIFEHILGKGNSKLSLTPELKTPIIGLGAPAGLILEDSVSDLGGTLLLPENGDVANALGAITSKVIVTCSASIIQTVDGFFRIQGINQSKDYESLDIAEKACIQELVEMTILKGQKSGTSERRVTVTILDKTADSAWGDQLFLERQFTSLLRGTPDLV